MVCCDFHRSHLELKEFSGEILRQAELGEIGASLLGEVIGHLEVDVIGREDIFSRPAFFNDFQQLVRNIDAPAILSAVLEPLSELAVSVMIEDINVQFSLLRETGEGEVATVEVSDGGTNRVRTEEQVKLGMEGMPQKQLNNNLLGAN